MARLTKRANGGAILCVANEEGKCCSVQCDACEHGANVWRKLADYEDMEEKRMTTQKVTQMTKSYSELSVDAIRNKIEADSKRLGIAVKTIALSSNMVGPLVYHYAIVVFERRG